MRKFILTAFLLLGLTACSQEAETTSADDGLIEAPEVNKVLSASDVKLEDSYDFAYSEAPIDDYDTYKAGNEIVITNDDKLQLDILGSNEPIENESNATAIVSSSDEEITLDGNYEYYRIDSDKTGDIVISVI